MSKQFKIHPIKQSLLNLRDAIDDEQMKALLENNETVYKGLERVREHLRKISLIF